MAVSGVREAGPGALGFGASVNCWEEVKRTEVALGGTGGALPPKGHSWPHPRAWRAVVSGHSGRGQKPAGHTALTGHSAGPQDLKGGRQEVLASRGCPGAQQQEALGGEEALEATGPRCSRRLSAGGSAGVAGPAPWTAPGTAPRLPGGGRLKPRPVAPEPHGLPGPQDTCPQAVARQEDSHVLGQCHQVSGAALGLGAREVVPAQHL